MNQVVRSAVAEDTNTRNQQALARASAGGLPEPVAEDELTDAEYRGFLTNFVSDHHVSQTPDVLEDRYRILLHKPMPEFNSTMGVAYEAVDERGERQNLYAVIAPTHLGYRFKTTEAFRTFSHPNLIALRAAGKVLLSNPREARFSVVFERPQGLRLSALIARQGAFPERFIIENIITPISEILSALEERGVNHGRINLDNLFYGEKLTVGECLSEPSGCSQPALFEPVERILTQTLGKGSGEVNADCYALGVVVFCMLTGRIPSVANDPKSYLRQIMQNGSYATLTQYQGYSPGMTDLLRGTLNDNRMERWGTRQLREWVGGKRFNLIPPSPPRESTRSFQFKGQDFMNCKALAHAFHEYWDDAIEELHNGKFNRWAQLSLTKNDMKDMIDKIVSRGTASASRSANTKADNEMLSRLIVALDPTGPLRMRSLSSNIDGLGAILADAFKAERHDILGYMFELIDNDIPNFWSDQHKSLQNQEISQMLWRLQKVRMLVRIRALGFGLERVLYELNPTMSCQSPLLLDRHVTDARQLLQALDDMATTHAHTHPPLDRHAAGFLTARLNINKEITLQEIGKFPDIAMDPKMVMLKMLALAQEKEGGIPLKGLANWMAVSLIDQIKRYNNRTIRELVIADFNKGARSGNLALMLKALINPAHVFNDRNNLIRAQALYDRNEREIRHLDDPKSLFNQAQAMGETIAVWTGYLVCIFISYIVLKSHFDF